MKKLIVVLLVLIAGMSVGFAYYLYNQNTKLNDTLEQMKKEELENENTEEVKLYEFKEVMGAKVTDTDTALVQEYKFEVEGASYTLTQNHEFNGINKITLNDIVLYEEEGNPANPYNNIEKVYVVDDVIVIHSVDLFSSTLIMAYTLNGEEVDLGVKRIYGDLVVFDGYMELAAMPSDCAGESPETINYTAMQLETLKYVGDHKFEKIAETKVYNFVQCN